jgi:hypothetical protein
MKKYRLRNFEKRKERLIERAIEKERNGEESNNQT